MKLNFSFSVACDLDLFLHWIHTEAGQCFGSVQFRPGLSGASQTLMSVQSWGPTPCRGPISLVGSVRPPLQAAKSVGLMDDTLSPGSSPWSPGFAKQDPSVLPTAPAWPVVTVLGCWSRPKSQTTLCMMMSLLTVRAPNWPEGRNIKYKALNDVMSFDFLSDMEKNCCVCRTDI